MLTQSPWMWSKFGDWVSNISGFRWVVDRELIGFMKERRVCDWCVCDGGIGCSSKMTCSSDDWEKGEKSFFKVWNQDRSHLLTSVAPQDVIPVFYHSPNQKASMGFCYN